MSDLTLRIDQTRCQGHAVCYMVAPELFEVDEDGRGSVKQSRIGPDQVEPASVAVERCPERAVTLSAE
jgi:ferredoxin